MRHHHGILHKFPDSFFNSKELGLLYYFTTRGSLYIVQPVSPWALDFFGADLASTTIKEKGHCYDDLSY